MTVIDGLAGVARRTGRSVNFAALRSFALTVTGLGSLSYAAYTVAPGWGFAAAGASLLVLDWLTGASSRLRR